MLHWRSSKWIVCSWTNYCTVVSVLFCSIRPYKVLWLGRLKTRDWKTLDHHTRGGKHETITMNAQATSVVKTKMDVIVHCWKHTSASNIHPVVINQCRKILSDCTATFYAKTFYIKRKRTENKKPSCRHHSRPYCLTLDYTLWAIKNETLLFLR